MVNSGYQILWVAGTFYSQKGWKFARERIGGAETSDKVGDLFPRGTRSYIAGQKAL